MNVDYKQEKDSQQRTGEKIYLSRVIIAVCFVNELDLFLRFTEQSVSSITKFHLKKNNSVATVLSCSRLIW